MAQSIFGGATSYEEQSLTNIKSDIIYWSKYAHEIKTEMDARLANSKKVIIGQTWDLIFK